MPKVNVRPKLKRPTHHISLSNKVDSYGLILEGGARGIQRVPQLGSNILQNQQGSMFGSRQPGLSELEMRTATGGRGSEFFSQDPTRFYDSMAAFTMVEGKVFPAPQYKFGTGPRETYQNLPGDVTWQPLLSGTRYAAATFTVGGAIFDPQQVRLWIRRIGSPGTLTAEIWTNSAGSPSALVASMTGGVDTNTVTDWTSVFHDFDMSAGGTLAASTAYWVVVYGASADNASSHWDIGVQAGAGASKVSSAGSTWSSADYTIYYRVEDAEAPTKYRFFHLSGQLYVATFNDDGTLTKIWMNGERGKATGGTATTLIDTNDGMDGTWVDDQWNGWYIRITAGAGAGQVRQITDTTAAGTITVDRDFDVTPTTTSQYVIYGGAAWQNVSPSGATAFATGEQAQSVAVQNDIAFFALGGSVPVKIMRFNSAGVPPVHQYSDLDSATVSVDVFATFFKEFTHVDDGPSLWYVNGSSAQRVSQIAWGASSVSIKPSSAIKVGGGGYDVQNGVIAGGTATFFKQTGAYNISGDKAREAHWAEDLRFIISPNNGEAAIVHEGDIWFSWGGFALMRVVGNTVQSVGPDRGIGLPDDRRGAIVDLGRHPNGLFACIDGGYDNTSSLLMRDDARQGWHEIFRAWDTNKRVRSVSWQTCPGTRPILWMSVGSDLVYQEWPQETFNPLEDSSLNYQHESHLVLADVDMGVVRLSKLFQDFSIYSENLTTGIEVHLDYQLDEDIGGTAWTRAETFYQSPEDELSVGRGEKKKARFRLRMLTNDADVPPIVLASIIEVFARALNKDAYHMRVRLRTKGRNLRGQKDYNPDDFIEWYERMADEASELTMGAVWERYNDVGVVALPIRGEFKDSFVPQTGGGTGTIVLTVMEI